MIAFLRFIFATAYWAELVATTVMILFLFAGLIGLAAVFV